ncbi:MAG: aldo/keto reductase [Daejeonella sp.]|uniref:aldo/keto reductase n=1 Tax=Daejeonella sp. TaxID=2805397 RepID=UPI00273608F1|nr:aldo/keto reductase [Daejeonella sp.]MDP3467536.1 aldo/keto reductase [Daejeonella sp.]
MIDKLALGTAQFGLNYGIANNKGQVKLSEIDCILNYANSQGINTIDTAIAYGDSEAQLGKVGINGWRVISKLPPLSNQCPNIRQWVYQSVEASLERLKIPCLYGLLLHKPNQLNEDRGAELYEALTEMESSSMVEQTGISVYETDELSLIDELTGLSIVQVPFNLIDTRFENFFKKLKENGNQVHVRSAFLQGLLLMEREERPKKFSRWESIWDSYEEFLKQSGTTRLEACINYVLSFIEVDNVIVGVDSLEQLKEICAAADKKNIVYPDFFKNQDAELINPALWSTFE